MSIFYSWFFSSVLVFIILSLVYFWLSADKYAENRQSIRKSYYVLFIVFMTIGFLTEDINMKDWKFVTQLTALFVFIDIAIFQTPDILKIWNTEFQHSDYIKKTIKKSEEVLGYNVKKVQKFNEIIFETPMYFQDKNAPIHWRQYRDNIREYLNLYADTFQFHIAVFKFDITTNTEELKQNIGQAFREVELCYNKEITDMEWKDSLITKLLDGTSIKLENKEDKTISNNPLTVNKKNVFIVSYFGENYNMLIGISSNYVEVDSIDASHILNMAQIFDWWLID